MQERYSIFASVGNSHQPFDRFVKMVDEAAERRRLSALIQTGHSPLRPRYAKAVDFITGPQFEAFVSAADYVITHAGAGSVMMALRYGKFPIVVPRRGDAGEHIDNHQAQLATELSRLGWCRVVSGVEELAAILAAPPAPVPLKNNVSNHRMRELVSDFIR
jgi:UDP-N-acetylglucosamine transferase subunit ALG13